VDISEVEFDLNPKKFKFNPLVLAMFFGGLLVFAIGIGLIFFKPQSEPDVKIISGNGMVAGDKVSPPAGGQIMVHVDGAVVRPAVYKLAADARVDDAIKAAGGMTSDADTKQVNLAAKLVDGQKVYIPIIGESVRASLATQNISGSVNQTTSTSVGQISINSASAEELDKLPGIGPVTAQKIIAGRPYGSVDELLSKKAVSNSVYEKIKAQIGL